MTHLATLSAKIARGERLTNAERCERQGLIFGHDGKCGAITPLWLRRDQRTEQSVPVKNRETPRL